MPAEIELSVNGQTVTVRAAAETPLLQVLRGELGLTGPKFGCAREQCYACAVLVDGEEKPSCVEPVESFVGRDILTVEGLADGDALHPVQEAFLEEEAAQCGYCIPGMVVGAVALLERNSSPTDQEIRHAMAPHLCRCGTQWRVLKAVRRAATREESSHGDT